MLTVLIAFIGLKGSFLLEWGDSTELDFQSGPVFKFLSGLPACANRMF